MIGLNRATGHPLTEDEHIDQSIADILTTPIGSRVMRRGYGSRLPELIDSPLNEEITLDIYVAAAEALQQWELRFKATRIRLADAQATGFSSIQIDGVSRKTGQVLSRLVGLPGRVVS